jgi:hypothetical protein
MTYNFDPDRWFDDQRRLLELRLQDGSLDQAAFDEATSELERRYDAMLTRLGGTYELKHQANDAKSE